MISFNGADALSLSDFLVHHPHLKSFTLNSQTIDDLELAVMEKLEEMGGDSNLPSIFVIDEAKGLHYRKSGEVYDWSF
jgi:hypothetical protein